MSEEKTIRLSKAAREFNVGASTIVEFLAKKGQNIDPSPNTKLTAEQYALVVKEYQGEKEVKKNADQLNNLIFKGKTITVGENDRPAAVEKKEEKVITIKTNSIPADEVNVPAKEEVVAEVKEPAKEQVAEPKAPVVEPAKETIEEPVEKPVKETVVEEKKEVVEETKIQEKVEVEPKVEKPVSEAAQDAVKLNVVGKIELPDVKKADVEVVYAKSFYAGAAHASGPLSGEVIGIVAGATPDEIRSALDAIEQKVQFDAYFEELAPGHAIYAHTVSSCGSYLAQTAGVPVGSALAYLIAPPLEAVVGLDAALKGLYCE